MYINSNVELISRIIEQKVYLIHKNKSQIVILEGIDNNYYQIIDINSYLYLGNLSKINLNNEVIISLDLFYYLNIFLNTTKVCFFFPNRIDRLLNYPNNIFINSQLYVTGVWNKNNLLNNIAITSIQNIESLIQTNKLITNKLILKIKKNKNLKKVKIQLKKILDDDFLIKDRWEEKNSCIQLVNVEKLFTYLIFVLLIVLCCVNLASSIIVLIIEKDQNNKVLYTMGLSFFYIKKIYFVLGLLIILISSIVGITIGLFIILIQLVFPFIITANSLPYPVKIELFNMFLVFITLIVFGTLVSWIVSRKLSY